MLALRDRFRRTANVIRDGRELELSTEEVVPGDLLVLREGDAVAADARIVDATGLEVDESMLTGESVPVGKDSAPADADAALGDRRSLAFAGTAVTRGRGTALVVATGDATEAGQIARLVATARPPRTPLQERLGTTARILAAGGVLLTVGLTAAMVVQGEPLRDAFFVGVSVAVAAVPEGLAATVTIALALGARAMADRGAIVSRLSAVETLGATTIVCTDKTGTLTENTLRVAAVAPARRGVDSEVLVAGALASSAELVDGDEGVRVAGDPVDGAILIAAFDEGLLDRVAAGRTLVHEEPFDPASRRMTRVYEGDEGRVAFSKGAPEVLLAEVGDERERTAAESKARAWAEQGLRVLAVSRRAGRDGEIEHVGLIGLHDPLRESAPAAIAGARAAGVGVKILTGDHPATANADRRRAGARAGARPRAHHAGRQAGDRRGAAGGGRGGRRDGRRRQRRARPAPRRRGRGHGPLGHRDGARGGGHRPHGRRLRHHRGRDPGGPADRRQRAQVRRVPALGEPG